MNVRALFNGSTRYLGSMFPGFFPEAKHNHYADFGYPVTLTFDQLHQMFERNGLARSAVEKTILKTWQDNPALWETEDTDETDLESDIRRRFADLRLWQKMADADRRSIVGGYAGVILRLADSKVFSAPVDQVPGGLEGLVEVIPAWAGQLTVASWDMDERSPSYGTPTMFNFNEAQLTGASQNMARAFSVHPDRVIVWSQDGTVHCQSGLAAGYNDLMTMEKVSGAGGEGFWKTARAPLSLNIDKDARLKDMADAMGVPMDEVADAMNDQVGDWQKGFDRSLLLQGMTATPLSISLPSPEHFFNVSLQSFAASMIIPSKILVGNQTGERASTEDARDWAQTCMARRVNTAIPAINGFVQRLERFSVIPERDWHINWSDLTESSMGEKLDRAAKMSGINAGDAMNPTFTPDEIRATLGYEPIGELGSDE